MMMDQQLRVAEHASERRNERQFVGAVCASLSHEIKNCLAIINENAGLMGDLALLAGQGRPVDPERQGRIAATIQNQVKRSDDLVRQLNRFAHSGDEDCRSLDLGDIIAFVKTLFEPTAAKAGVPLTTGPIADVTIETAPLELIQLLWLLMAAGVDRCAGDGVTVSTEATIGRVMIRIEVHPLSAAPPPPLSDGIFDLAQSMGGTLEQAPDKGGINLSLPLKAVPRCPEGP